MKAGHHLAGDLFNQLVGCQLSHLSTHNKPFCLLS
jgi:hypothetical protein